MRTLAKLNRSFLKKIHKIHRKTLFSESLFNNVARLQLETLLKKRLQCRCFPVNFAKYFRTKFLAEQFWVTCSSSSKYKFNLSSGFVYGECKQIKLTTQTSHFFNMSLLNKWCLWKPHNFNNKMRVEPNQYLTLALYL